MTDDDRITDVPDAEPPDQITEEPAALEPESEPDREGGWNWRQRSVDVRLRGRNDSLASPWTRLAAAVIDVVILMVVVLPISLAEDSRRHRGEPEPTLAVLAGLAFLAWVIVQTVLLSTRGQSVGKLIVGIRIVRVTDGRNPGFASAVLTRSVVPTLIGVIPCVGPLFLLVNVLYIFQPDRRRLQDHMAGTVVVLADTVRNPPDRPDGLPFRRDDPL